MNQTPLQSDSQYNMAIDDGGGLKGEAFSCTFLLRISSRSKLDNNIMQHVEGDTAKSGGGSELEYEHA